jgi:hypothetical protein
VATCREDWQAAQPFFLEGAALHLEGPVRQGIAQCLTGLAVVAHGEEQPLLAARLLGIAWAAWEASTRNWLAPITRAEYDRIAPAVRAEIGEDAYAAAWNEGFTSDIDEAVRSFVGRHLGAR